MLPNMTSSKSGSSRSSMIPSSLSLSSFRSSSSASTPSTTNDPNPGSRSASTAAASKGNKLRRKSGIEIPNFSHSQRTNSRSPERQTSPTRTVEPQEEPVPPRKARTWSNRISTFLPSLITNDTDQHTGSVRRKPVGSSISSPPPPPTSAPPPYQVVDPNSPQSPSRNESIMSPTASPPILPPRQDTSHISRSSVSSMSPPLIETQIPTSSFSTQYPPHPQIMAPTPPSPEVRRATLMKQEPAAKAGTQRSSTSTVESSPTEPSPRQGKLQKENHGDRSRRNSLQQPTIGQAHSELQTAVSGPTAEQRGRRVVSAQTPPPEPNTKANRISSLPLGPQSVNRSDTGSQSPSRGRLRRSWLPGGRSRSNSVEVTGKGQNSSYAWVMSGDTQAEYNPSFLKNGEKVPELWNESGNVYVYLYPRGSGCGPSFKVMEFTVSSSYVFNELIQSDREPSSGTRSRARSFGGRNSLTADDAARIRSPPTSPPLEESPGDLKLYLPTAPPSADSGQLSSPGQSTDADLERLIAIRNLFAFLTGQPLVGTKAQPSTFRAFLKIAELLEEFGFASAEGATFGNAVDLSFEFYIDQLGLADCRNSREKTIEALILGERMRSIDLYNEAFAHAAGKYTAIMDLKLPLFELINPHTRLQLEKAHLDLINRQQGVNLHVEQFDFPSLFAGIANSTSISELKHVRFKIWKNSFTRLRSFVLSHYKSTFGSWPPKASSSKNPFAESGLNRLVLKVLYSDMCALYDLLVDRTKLTSRVMDEVPAISSEPSKMTMSALSNIMSEFDRSKPPVLPPVPFDRPQLPSMTSVLETYPTLSAKEQIKFDKNVKEHELMLILNKAYNYDANRIKLPFLDKFKEFEAREAKGKMAPDLVDQRMGYWLFLYVTIQSLPMLVVDAPGLKYTEGVEYFLCEPPMGNPPWIEDRQVRRMWYEVAGGGGLVQLSADAVLFSVEATYHRSHCWLASKKWQGFPDVEEPPPEEPALPILQPPPPVLQDDIGGGAGTPPLTGSPTPPPGMGSPVQLRPRNLSPGGGRANRASQAYRSSMALGLEPVPMEPQPPFGSHNRSSSQGPRPLSSNLGARSRSFGNLAAANQQQRNSYLPKQDSPADDNSGATFDDIIGQPEKKPAKKKGFGFF